MNNATRSALKIAGIYLLAGGLWILLSDTVLLWLVSDVSRVAQWQTFKGWFFVLATGIMLFFSLRKWASLFFEDIARRKQAEDVLYESERRFRDMLGNVKLIAMTLDVNGQITFCNDYMLQLTGWKREEVMNKDWFSIFIPESSVEVKNLFLETIVTGDIPSHYENAIQTRAGELRQINWNNTILRDAAGRVFGTASIGDDVTDRMRAAEELRRAEEKYRSIFETVPVGIYQLSVDGTYHAVNQEFVRLLGYESSEELIASTSGADKEFYVKSGRRADLIEQLRAKESVTGFESQVYRKDRSIIWISENARGLHDANGSFTGLEGIATEITSRKRTEESMQRLIQAVEQANDVVFMTDVQGNITYVNPAFEQTYGYTAAEAYMNTPRMLKSGVQENAFYARLWNTVLSGQNIRVELINKTKDGHLLTMESTVSPVLDSNLGLTGFIAVQRDVTSERTHEEERNVLEKQLFQAQKLESIGTLAGGIAHDFNNVLGIILGYATILRRELPESGKAGRSIDAINNAVQRGAGLVRQILMFARKGEITFVPLVVNDLIRELHMMIQETFPKTIIVPVTLDPDLPPIEADRTQIHQLLLNLCINARDAMLDGGTLAISTSKVSLDELRTRVPDAEEDEFVRISVRDTGTGMDEATQQKIFEPFFTTKELGKGTGLGLAVVYGIVKNHRGHIVVQSTPGHGSTFDVYLPILSTMAAAENPLAERLTPSSGGTETILLVEDEEMLRELLTGGLKSRGYTVLTAADGEAAVKTYAQSYHDIALVISDLGLPKLDGIKVFEEFKRINSRVKVLIASGFIDQAVKSELLNNGARGFIHKPYVMGEILRKVREVIDAA